jgi:hypothetical protein
MVRAILQYSYSLTLAQLSPNGTEFIGKLQAFSHHASSSAVLIARKLS